MRKPSKQRLEVWAADVFKLQAASSRQEFDALDTTAADSLPILSKSAPAISAGGMEKLAERVASVRDTKARK